MSLFSVLQVIIAIILIYLTLSLLVTEIQEAFASFLQFRAKNLKDSITILLGEEPGNNGNKETLTDAIYKTHRIKSLNQYTTTWLSGRPLYKNLGPSYIKKEDFADAVLEHLDEQLDNFITNNPHDPNDPNDPQSIEVDVIIEKINNKNPITLINTKKDFGDDVIDEFDQKLKKLNEESEKLNEESEKLNEESEKLNEESEKLNKDSPNNPKISIITTKIDAVEKKINGVKQKISEGEKNISEVKQKRSEVKQIISEIHNKQRSINQLDPLLQIAQSIKLKKESPKLKDFKQELESLFQKAEEKTIDVYKRNAKGVSFLIGFLLAMFLNIDFFYIVDKVAKNPDLAARFSENSKILFEDNIEKYNTYYKCVEDKGEKECQAEDIAFQEGVKKSIPEASLSEIIGLRNPINNGEPKTSNGEPKTSNGEPNKKNRPILVRISGWIISAIAMAMGAPFWFDLLGKFLNVRNAAKPFEPKITALKKEEDKKKKAE
ncbi:hypothetical protein [Crocosphaera sp.]|uniref:coiled-coil domain-containing protein n=1 Tax=Crocosphaera sp. TaxID=2729996 RepID=UPI002627B652|nr:hypothetical protein [Crocosphaera sp.]MDJ0582941.1 hypothetical protein [Crocosphaera sp.]